MSTYSERVWIDKQKSWGFNSIWLKGRCQTKMPLRQDTPCHISESNFQCGHKYSLIFSFVLVSFVIVDLGSLALPSLQRIKFNARYLIILPRPSTPIAEWVKTTRSLFQSTHLIHCPPSTSTVPTKQKSRPTCESWISLSKSHLLSGTIVCRMRAGLQRDGKLWSSNSITLSLYLLYPSWLGYL